MSEITAVSVFQDSGSYQLALSMAQPLANSELVPVSYRGKENNCIIALEMAHRIGMSPIVVMNNLNIIHGRQSWGSSFIIALINSCRRFTPLRFKFTGEGTAKKCYAYAKAKEDGEIVNGPEVSIAMAVAEGWYNKSGSKWPNMPDLMLSYRAAAFFGRLYCPDILMGLQTTDEIQDVGIQEIPADDNGAIEAFNNEVAGAPEKQPVGEEYAFEEVPAAPVAPAAPMAPAETAPQDIEVAGEEVVQAAADIPPPPPSTMPLEEDDDF